MKKELEKLNAKEKELAEKTSEIIQIRKTIDNVLYYAELNHKMQFLNINKRFLVALNYDENELIGKNHNIISHPNEKINTAKILEELNKNSVFKIKTSKLTKTKQEIYLYLTYTLITDNNNSIKIILFGHEAIRND